MARNTHKNVELAQTLETLVDELMKDQPNQAKVKKLSLLLGISYSGDALTQMNAVLCSMDSLNGHKMNHKNPGTRQIER